MEWIMNVWFSSLVVLLPSPGLDVAHSLINISIIFVLLRVAGGTRFSVGFAFIFNTVSTVLNNLTVGTPNACRTLFMLREDVR